MCARACVCVCVHAGRCVITVCVGREGVEEDGVV